MRQEIIDIYEFHELSEDAKKVALEDWRNTNYEYGYAWDSENQDTLKAFADLFDLIQTRAGYFLKGDISIKQLTGIRLMAYLWNNYGHKLYKGKYYSVNGVGSNAYRSRRSNCQIENNCVLTGYCIDDDILQPIYEAMKKPYNGDFDDLIADCVQSWKKAVEADKEYQDSEEYLLEHAAANKFEYYENGKRY